jgi:23S rRNA (cytidine1920-2'-O)/16S rRNA (cytidine1409-2'-O)-methyltransferase
LKTRLDQALVDRGICPSRTAAQRAVMAGRVRVNGRAAAKPGDAVRSDDLLVLAGGERYVSRGGHKLEHALGRFAVAPGGARCLDVGASTGGFTDCLLQHGAARVHAVDVGRGQLAWTLRTDPRVVVREGVNARHLVPADFSPGEVPFDLVVADCSFISLRLVLPPLAPLVRPGGDVVALVKPQFEAGKAEADRGAGVITDPAVHAAVLRDLREFVASALPVLAWIDVAESPLLGPAGNREFLAHLRRDP